MEQRITLDTQVAVVRMELAQIRELVAPSLWVAAAVAAVPMAVAAEAALAVSVNQEAPLQMVASDYLATSPEQRFFMVAAVADLPTYQRLAQVAMAAAGTAVVPLLTVLQV
jgi:hypothetical protein